MDKRLFAMSAVLTSFTSVNVTDKLTLTLRHGTTQEEAIGKFVKFANKTYPYYKIGEVLCLEVKEGDDYE